MEQPPERKRYSLAQREALLARFDAAGVSAKAFARSEGVKYPTFLYWLNARERGRRPHNFVEIERAPADRPESGIEIFAPGGIVLRAFDASTAAALARELAPTC